MSYKKQNRRSFLNQLGIGCAHVGATSLLAGITNMGLLNSAAAANRSWVNSSAAPYKAIVCIYLAGGNDSFNMLTPLDDGPYTDYKNSRGNMAIEKADFHKIYPTNTSDAIYGVHPKMPNIASLFDSGDAAFIANCGVIAKPTTMTDFRAKRDLPIGLFSHSHQTNRWQSSLPRDGVQANGWGGRLADILKANNVNQDISMSISLGGTNLFQRGKELNAYTIKNSDNGSTLINNSTSTSAYERLKRETLDDVLEQSYQNVLRTAYADVATGSKSNSIEFNAAIASGDAFSTTFGSGTLSKDLKMVARTIAARNVLNVANQTFFITVKGYDTHSDHLLTHGNLMGNLDTSLAEFYSALDELGMKDNVTTFTMSDFGRKLISNGDGTDHAWGGNSLVLGGAVQGKKIYGNYPSLALDSALDTGGGRFIPTTSTDEYFAELALWLGASGSDLPYILPNLGNFWTPGSGTASPLGLLA